MHAKQVVYALAAIWLALFVVSFVSLQFVEESVDETRQNLLRVATFLTWQALAFVAAVVLAIVTYRAAARGVQRVKLPGYAPLALSVFIVGSFIAILAYRVFVVPALALS